jgi:4-amino-4-deoxy-L-arabinose transferase-like glycosyltransferase
VISARRERVIIAFMLAGYILLALAFSLGPIFEGPDEIEHYRFIRALAQTRALPDPRSQERAQYHQAPLYYLLAAPLALLSDDTDFTSIDGRINPFYPYQLGIPGNDNKNLYVHTRAEDFPYAASGTARAVHLIRLLSVALGTCTVLVGVRIFRLLWPDRPDRRLMAQAVVAFTPQFLYLSGTINNDNLLYLLTTLTLFLLLSQRRNGFTARSATLLGVVLGAALLTKVNAAFLVFPVGLAIALDRRAWRYVPILLVVLVAVAGWWYVRNLVLYGDLTAVRVLLETWKTETIRPGALALDVGLSRLPYAYQTYWARFGQGAVPVAQPIYVFFDGLTIISALGVVFWWAKRRPPLTTSPSLLAERGSGGEVLLLLVFGLSWLAALIYYASTAWSGNQGRYLLPGVAAWGALISLGLDQWTPRRLKAPVALSFVLILATVAAITVFGYFLPSYRASSVTDVPERALSLQYGDVAQLVGMSPSMPKARPGDLIRITLYWRALRPAPDSLLAYLHSAGSDVVKRDSLPGTGNLLSTDWQPGQAWAEHYVVMIPPDASPQNVYPLLAGLYDPAAAQNLPAASADGKPVDPLIGRIAISGPAQPLTSDYRFGESIGLAQPQIKRDGDRLHVCMRWLSLAPVSSDYQVFVHVLVGDKKEPFAQADFQPKNGRYPTGAWSPGEAVDDCATLDVSGLPVSGWRVALGLYDLDSQKRLPVRNANGNLLADNRVLVEGSR